MASSCFNADYDPCDRSREISNAEETAHTMSEEKNIDNRESPQYKDDHEYE